MLRRISCSWSEWTISLLQRVNVILHICHLGRMKCYFILAIWKVYIYMYLCQTRNMFAVYIFIWHYFFGRPPNKHTGSTAKVGGYGKCCSLRQVLSAHECWLIRWWREKNSTQLYTFTPCVKSITYPARTLTEVTTNLTQFCSIHQLLPLWQKWAICIYIPNICTFNGFCAGRIHMQNLLINYS